MDSEMKVIDEELVALFHTETAWPRPTDIKCPHRIGELKLPSGTELYCECPRTRKIVNTLVIETTCSRTVCHVRSALFS
jgi:hypothetical protein